MSVNRHPTGLSPAEREELVRWATTVVVRNIVYCFCFCLSSIVLFFTSLGLILLGKYLFAILSGGN